MPGEGGVFNVRGGGLGHVWAMGVAAWCSLSYDHMKG
jgi:hypothetical protein